MGFLSRYLPLSEAEHDAMYERVKDATSNPQFTSADPTPPARSSRPSMRDRAANGSAFVQVATDFAAAVRANL